MCITDRILKARRPIPALAVSPNIPNFQAVTMVISKFEMTGPSPLAHGLIGGSQALRTSHLGLHSSEFGLHRIGVNGFASTPSICRPAAFANLTSGSPKPGSSCASP